MTTKIGNVRLIRIEEEMKGSYLDYAMSVIVSRALPDIRDGLKPVQRRILYAINELGLHPTSPHKKSARIVGEVLGKYHPHGDAPVYDAMVRMAQGFSMRYVLIDGQGNFGSVDGDPPAAMRYTEARLAPIAREMLSDIEKNTVDFTPNFDGTLHEPTVLPAILPNLLVNGSSGIAVGMATNIPPHNLGEVCDGVIHLIDDPDAGLDELLELVHGPDFPTGAIIQGKGGIKQAYTTGQGKIVLRARTTLEEVAKGKRTQILVTELPYQINKASLVEKIAELAREKRIDGIAEVRDESDREGMRIVIEIKREAQPEQVLNNLYEHTPLQSAFFINMLALVDGQPRVINLKTALQHYIDFRRQVIVRRSEFELARARERAHILEGLVKAIQHLDEVIALIRKAPNADEARAALMQRFAFTQAQVQAILDMQLRRLSALERQKLLDEQAEVLKAIAHLEAILADPRKRDALIKEEVLKLKSQYADKRLTEINEEEVTEFRIEDLLPQQEVVITLSQRGYVKRLPSDTYRLQRRGGRGLTGGAPRDEDAVQHLLVANTHDLLLFFTNRGRAFPIKCYEIPPDSSRTSKSTPLVNLVPLSEKERVMAVLALGEEDRESLLLLATQKGKVKKTPMSPFASMRGRGLIATKLEKGDEMISVALAWDEDEVLIVTERGMALRFRVANLPLQSRHGSGVRGIRLGPGDRAISMGIVKPDTYLFTATTKGLGKRTRIGLYPTKKRSGKGILTFKVSEKTGHLAAARIVHQGQEAMIVSEKGVVFRTDLDKVSIQGRLTKGVSVMKLDENDRVASVACLNGHEARNPQLEKKEKGNTEARGRG